MFIDFRDRGRERNVDWLLPIHAPTENRICNLGVCPDWELNLQLLGIWDDAPIY